MGWHCAYVLVLCSDARICKLDCSIRLGKRVEYGRASFAAHGFQGGPWDSGEDKVPSPPGLRARLQHALQVHDGTAQVCGASLIKGLLIRLIGAQLICLVE